MHNCGAETSDDPNGRVMQSDYLKIEIVLKESKARPNRKAGNRGVDRESNSIGADEINRYQRLQHFFDQWAFEAGEARIIHAEALRHARSDGVGNERSARSR